MLTSESYEEVVAFYADIVGPREQGYVLVETTSGDTPTRYVTIAVHLEGKYFWPGTGLQSIRQIPAEKNQ